MLLWMASFEYFEILQLFNIYITSIHQLLLSLILTFLYIPVVNVDKLVPVWATLLMEQTWKIDELKRLNRLRKNGQILFKKISPLHFCRICISLGRILPSTKRIGGLQCTLVEVVLVGYRLRLPTIPNRERVSL